MLIKYDLSSQIKAEDDQPLPGVLLSLSGGLFRSNLLTQDNGILTFSNLVRPCSAAPWLLDSVRTDAMGPLEVHQLQFYLGLDAGDQCFPLLDLSPRRCN